MDFVNQAYAQGIELIRSMSVGTRFATGLLFALVVISLAYLLQYQATGGDELLLGGRAFDASELTAMEAAFSKAGLGRWQTFGNQIRVPRGQKELYMAALADGNALPPDFSKYLDEATAADNPFASVKSLEMRRWNAKQKTLALIIKRMRGIEDATIQYDEEVKRGLTPHKQKTAMVAIRTRGGQLEEEQIRAIRNVVASAYAGLDRHHVTITDMTSGYSYGGQIGPDGLPEDESLYAAYKQRHERAWQQKITQQLAYIPGVVVGVNVELNPEVEKKLQTIKLDPKPVTLAAQESSKDSKTQTPFTGGRPGAQSNGVSNTALSLQQTGGTNSGESSATETHSDIRNLPGSDTAQITHAALTPKKVTASIDVPASYYIAVWNQRNAQSADKSGKTAKQPDPAELATIETATKNQIKERIRNLLPDVQQGTNPYPHIVVETYVDLPTTVVAKPALAATAGEWFASNWQTLGLVGLGLFSLIMLRSMIRSPIGLPSPGAGVAVQAAEAGPLRVVGNDVADDDDEPEPAKVLRTHFHSTGPNLKSELQEIVKENPDAAAAILRAWIGDAA
jgi:flagellar M-ring protein FliF